MHKFFTTLFLALCVTILSAQTWNPFVNNALVSPQPMLPLELNGTGNFTFTVGNTGTSSIPLVVDQEMTLVVTLASGEPDNVNPLNALGGTWLGFFDWTYVAAANSFVGTQNQVIPASANGTITIAYKVNRNTPESVSANGFNVNVQPPPFTNGVNITSDDAVSEYTFVRATDYGDAPVSYGEAGSEINYFKDISGNYENLQFLGDTVDYETSYLVSPDADGDDNDQLNDEDGVTFPTLIQGTTVTLPVSLTVYGGVGFLNGWIDWNADGDFLDAGEQIVTNQPVATTQTLNWTLNIPASAVAGTTFARFRFGFPQAGPLGFSDFGEVEDYMITIIAAEPEINLVKTGTYQDNAPTGIYNAGDQINYTFSVTNTGNVPLTNVTVTDPLVTVSGAPIATLSPGATDNTTFTAVYTLTQADIDAGTFTNTATATGTFNGNPVTDTDDDVQNFTQTPSIEIVKLATPQTYSTLDETITYTFTVTNTGNVTLTNVNVTDPLSGLSAITPASVTLAPGANQVFTATYNISQADLNSGNLVNTATATGTPPFGPNVTDTDTETIAATQTPSIDLVKSASPNIYSVEGEVITYSFTVTNNGNVTLTNVNVTDPLVGLSIITPASVTLAPGANQVFTATYSITQANLDAGSVLNTATATGTPPAGGTVTDTDTETISATQTPSIDIAKLASPQTYNAVDQTITYSFTVTNTGNVTLTSVNVTDPLSGLSAITPASVTLAPGANQVFTATYSITQANLDAGSIVNTATATGTPPAGGTVTDTDTETITANQTPSIDIAKLATPQTYNAVDQTITYSFTVTNTGNVTLTNVNVTDPLSGLSSITPASVTLAPGANQVFTATYSITQANLDAGNLVNTATATGTPPVGGNVTDTDTETITATQTPSIDIAKVASPQTYSAVGNVVTYNFTVTNTGNVTLTNVNVTDPLSGLSVITPASVTLAPGANQLFTATYTITQADLNAGSVVNTATATGTPPNGPNVTDTDTETITANQTPSIDIAKVASPQTYSAVGDVITYTFTVENTGNVTLTNVNVTDPLVGLSSITPASVSLAPGLSQVFTATYSITQADLDGGSVVNTATATGTPPVGDPVTDTDTETITANQTPGIQLTKTNTNTPQRYSYVGDILTYNLVVTNTGNVTLTDIVVSDPVATVSGSPISSLAPNASTTVTAQYVVTLADLQAGTFTNTASATGNYTDVNGDPQTVTDSDDATVPAVIPDVTPIITAIPNVMQGLTEFNLTVRVTELNDIATNGLITVRIPKDVRLSLSSPYDPGLTSLGSTPLNNSVWTFSEDANNYIFTTTSVIEAGGFSTFGFVAEFDPGNTKGVYTLTSQIDSFSGGELRIDNNVDSEKIDYFIN